MREHWKGIFKLIEEMGELSQLLGKAGPFPRMGHPDGRGEARERLPKEIADVYAALDYFVETNLPQCGNDITSRRKQKLNQYRDWGLTGVFNVEYNG
jgi:hypothetical protein